MKCTWHIYPEEHRNILPAVDWISVWPSEMMRSILVRPRSFRSENIPSNVSSCSASATLAPRISCRYPSVLTTTTTRRALLTYFTPSLTLKYDASTSRNGMWESMALSINSVTFTSSSCATLETYNAEIWLTPRWEITFSTFQVDTP